MSGFSQQLQRRFAAVQAAAAALGELDDRAMDERIAVASSAGSLGHDQVAVRAEAGDNFKFDVYKERQTPVPAVLGMGAGGRGGMPVMREMQGIVSFAGSARDGMQVTYQPPPAGSGRPPQAPFQIMTADGQTRDGPDCPHGLSFCLSQVEQAMAITLAQTLIGDMGAPATYRPGRPCLERIDFSSADGGGGAGPKLTMRADGRGDGKVWIEWPGGPPRPLTVEDARHILPRLIERAQEVNAAAQCHYFTAQSPASTAAAAAGGGGCGSAVAGGGGGGWGDCGAAAAAAWEGGRPGAAAGAVPQHQQHHHHHAGGGGGGYGAGSSAAVTGGWEGGGVGAGAPPSRALPVPPVVPPLRLPAAPWATPAPHRPPQLPAAPSPYPAAPYRGGGGYGQGFAGAAGGGRSDAAAVGAGPHQQRPPVPYQSSPHAGTGAGGGGGQRPPPHAHQQQQYHQPHHHHGGTGDAGSSFRPAW